MLAEDLELELGGARIAAHRLRLPGTPPSPARPVLVFLHEGLGCIEMWKSFPARLAAATGCPALLYDRRGNGRSSPLSEPRGIDYLHRAALDELPAVLEACGVTRPILVGHSDGGSIALLYASQHPARGLIAEAAHVHVEEQALIGIRQMVRQWQSSPVHRLLHRYHGDKTEALFAAWADTWLAPWFRGWTIEDCLPAVTCPALVLQGLEDEYATPAHAKLIRARLGGEAEVLLLPGCARSPRLQAEEATLAAAIRFVRKVCG